MGVIQLINMIKIILSFVITFFVAALGSVVTTPSINSWYTTIQKAPFNPPNWIFGPVWTLLFILMAISLYLVWQKTKFPLIFVLQLFLNFFWSYSFFYFQSPFLGLLNVVVLLFLIIATIVYFSRLNRLAAWLLAPYLLWTSFALILNFSIWWIN